MKPPYCSQRGFTLVEVGIALALSLMLGAALLWPQIVQFRVNKASAQGKQLVTLSNSVATYMTIYYSQLVNNQPIAGFANIYAPTVAELKTANIALPANFNATNFYGGSYAISISKVPAACVPPACDIVSMTNLTNAIIDPLTGRTDGAALGAALDTVGADGGYSNLATPGSIIGQGGAWTVTNPAGSVAGILGIRAGYGSSGWAQFLRRDGQLPMTGSLNMGNQNINNTATLNSTTIANSGNTTIGGTLGVTGQTTTNGVTNNGTLTTGATTITGNATITGNSTVQGNSTMLGTLAVSGLTTTAGITNNGPLQNNGNISNTGDVRTSRLWLQTIVSNGGSCTGLNGYQAATAAGSIASCINGQWTTPNATTSVPPPCSSQSITWGSTSGCAATLPATTSGNTATVSANSPNNGSATFVCSSGSWSYQSGSCSMQCSSQTLTWGSGCQASFPATGGGSSATRSATNSPHSGSATFNCNSTNGTWSYSSGSCTSPSPCSGSVSWGNGNCSATYSLSSGSGTWLSYSGSNTYAGYNLGGSISGSAYASCNNGSLSVSSKSCNFSGSNFPKAYNLMGGGGAPMTLYLVSGSVGPYCSSLLGGGSTASYTLATCPHDDHWFTWVGRTANMNYSGMVSGNGCNHDGCSCWAWRTHHAPHLLPPLVYSLTCTNNN